jgi:predicted peptidase
MPQESKHFHTTITKDIALNYLLSLPSNYDKSQQWPMILFLHGAGERGDDLNLVAKHGPPKRAARGDDLPFVIVSPQCPEYHWWSDFPEALIGLVDETIATYSVDRNRVYLTGLSMGGFGTWHLSRAYPDRFAASAPICGGLPWHLNAEKSALLLKNMPIWVFHGEKDPVVSVDMSIEMVTALKAAGNDVQFTVYPDLEHDSWTVTYDNSELYEWFLSHKLPHAGK